MSRQELDAPEHGARKAGICQAGIRKATVTAPANIAFVKYWGARNLERALPHHPSISMTLSACHSRSTVEHRLGPGEDSVYLLDGKGAPAPAPPAFRDRAVAHLERLARWAAGEGQTREGHFRVVTANSFPAAAGLASSASGFAALTLAAVRALGREITVEEASALARSSGSGSAARSVLGGFVEWPGPEAGPEGPAVCLADAEHWPLADVIALVETGPKEVSSLDGHRRAASSPHFAERLGQVPGRLERVRQAIETRDLEALGEVVEEDSIELHLVAMSSRPPIFYWRPATLAVLEEVRALRRGGLGAWATMDAGANVHTICALADSEAVAARLEAVPGVARVIRDRCGSGPRDEETGYF